MKAKRVTRRIAIGLSCFLALIAVLGALVMLLWNALVPELFDGVQYASRAFIVVALFFIGLEFTRETLRNLRGGVLWQALLLWAAVVPLTLWVALYYA